MIRYLCYTAIMTGLISCDSTDAPDCFKSAGTTVEQNIKVEPFNRIRVNRDISLKIIQSDEQQISIRAGENLIDGIQVSVEDGQLLIENNINCNFFRDYNSVGVTVFTPELTEIRNSSQFDVTSQGILRFPRLNLVSENFNIDALNTGNFILDIENERLTITVNGLTNVTVSGSTTSLLVNYTSGNSRFEGGALIAQDVEFYHRASNDLVVNPQRSLKGVLYGTGDVISLNRPPIIEVTSFYDGELLFRD